MSKSTIVVSAICLATAAMLTASGVAADSRGVAPQPTRAHAPTYTLSPCASEDSDNCYWDATRRGNGTGRSFVTLHGVTYYYGK